MYTLELTKQDIKTLAFVSYRYGWSAELQGYEPGIHEISEPDAWEWREAVADDMEGGYDIFPMLDPNSDLYIKLADLHFSIV